MEHIDLLKNSFDLDAQLAEQAASKESIKVTLPENHDALLSSIQETGDPFGGNPNNRRVAERIATDGTAKSIQENALPSKVVDVERAKQALELSADKESAKVQQQQDEVAAKNADETSTGPKTPVWRKGA